MNYDTGTGEWMEISGGRRLTIAPDALSVDLRSGRNWHRSRVIPYEDIRAVYRFEKPDTQALVVSAYLWLALLALVMLWAWAARWHVAVMGLSVFMLSLAMGGLALFRYRSAPARFLRIAAYSGELVVPDRAPGFFSSLAARIHVAEAAPAAAQGTTGYFEAPSPPSVSTAENSESS